MLLDKPRVQAYYDAIVKTPEQFKDKVVLDVGAGTGILSIFCAQAGAKKVFSIEASNLAEIAVRVVKENNLENIVEVIQKKVEDFELPKEYKNVDIIVSEWMGFYLLHEGMLDSVLYARDKFLIPGGQLIPDTASLYVAPCSVPSRFDDWENVAGVKMTTFADQLRLQKSKSPEIMDVHNDHLLHEGVMFAYFDLHEINIGDFEELTFNEVTVIQKPGKYQGVCIWFECNMSCYGDNPVLSTAPNAPKTHWQQTVLIFPDSETVREVEKDEPVAFNLIIKRKSDNKRRYDIELTMLNPNEVEHQVPCSCYMTKCILAKAYLQSTIESELKTN